MSIQQADWTAQKKTLSEAVFLLSHEGVIRMANREASRLAGCGESDLIGKDIWAVETELVPPEKLGLLSCTGGSVEYQARAKKKTLMVRVLLVTDRYGQKCFLCLVRDANASSGDSSYLFGREERICGLKQEVNALLRELRREPRYGV